MPSPDESVLSRIHSLLDTTKGAVSSGAFQRHGEVVNTSESTIKFLAEIESINTETSSKTQVESECPICHGSPPNLFSECVLRNPFSEDEHYERVLKKTHHRIDCPKCSGVSEIACHRCNGNGRSTCSSCDGAGRREYDEECWKCEETEYLDANCPECGGTKVISNMEPCRNCNGKGHVMCPTCGGNGFVSCNRCQGNGVLHKYDQTRYEVARSVTVSGLASFWESEPIKIANEFNWNRTDFDILENGRRTIRLRTPSCDAVFVSLKYGDDYYNALLGPERVIDAGIWDPQTGYPKTSFRRKLGDLKSRLLR